MKKQWFPQNHQWLVIILSALSIALTTVAEEVTRKFLRRRKGGKRRHKRHSE